MGGGGQYQVGRIKKRGPYDRGWRQTRGIITHVGSKPVWSGGIIILAGSKLGGIMTKAGSKPGALQLMLEANGVGVGTIAFCRIQTRGHYDIGWRQTRGIITQVGSKPGWGGGHYYVGRIQTRGHY